MTVEKESKHSKELKIERKATQEQSPIQEITDVEQLLVSGGVGEESPETVLNPTADVFLE